MYHFSFSWVGCSIPKPGVITLLEQEKAPWMEMREGMRSWTQVNDGQSGRGRPAQLVPSRVTEEAHPRDVQKAPFRCSRSIEKGYETWGNFSNLSTWAAKRTFCLFTTLLFLFSHFSFAFQRVLVSFFPFDNHLTCFQLLSYVNLYSFFHCLKHFLFT